MMTTKKITKKKYDADYHRKVMAQILCSIRKSFAMTQMEFADQLQISQSKVSKLESGSLDITASQWILLTKKLDIPYFYTDIGCIDLLYNKIKPASPAYKMSKELGKVKNVSARYLRPAVIPMFNYDHPKDHLLGLEQDFFVNLANKVNSRILLKKENFDFEGKFWNEEFSTDLVHGKLHADLIQCGDARERLELFAKNSSYYFEHYKVELEIKNNKVNVAYTPDKDTVSLANTADKKHENALCHYNQHFLEGIVNYGNEKKILAKHQHCTHKGESFCLFEFTV